MRPVIALSPEGRRGEWALLPGVGKGEADMVDWEEGVFGVTSWASGVLLGSVGGEDASEVE